MLAEAGYDVQLAAVGAGHWVPAELAVQTITEVLGL
jgi:hypothetical protein